jgi:hypothetical protein
MVGTNRSGVHRHAMCEGDCNANVRCARAPTAMGREVEATTGFEPVNRGFADLRVEPLHHVATGPPDSATRASGGSIWVQESGCPSRIRTSPNGFKVRCPTTRRRGNAAATIVARASPGARKWSGRRDSNPRPSPWQGDALPTEPLPLGSCAHRVLSESRYWCREPDSNWRHRDFQSRALPTELSRPGGSTGSGGSPTASRTIARAFEAGQSSGRRSAGPTAAPVRVRGSAGGVSRARRGRRRRPGSGLGPRSAAGGG